MSFQKPSSAVIRKRVHGLTVYIGPDWLLAVDRAAEYMRSMTVAPLLVLAEPGKTIAIHADGSEEPIVSNAILAAPGSVGGSPTVDSGGLFLYFDPVTAAGRAITRLAGSHPSGHLQWTLPDAVDWSADFFSRLLLGGATDLEIDQWQASVRSELLQRSGLPDLIEWRLKHVAEALRENPGGRIESDRLAGDIGWSAPHLRDYFRIQVGMSMSKYQVWCRIFKAQTSLSSSATDRLLHAGFYDASHGIKAIRKYLGVPSSRVRSRS